MSTELEVVADFGDQCGECPVWDNEEALLYWTDLMSHRFYRYERNRGVAQIIRERLQVKGFRLNQSGSFVIANAQGVWL